MLMCRDLLSLSLREIGSAFGDRDVSTVLSALERARQVLSEDRESAERVARIGQLLRATEAVRAPSRR
jgi:chromosomal replication initiation ATPase DnaA